jgi:NAD(P)H-hydrate epimerase
MFNLREIYHARDPWVHKGQFGKLLVIGGSYWFTGSPWYNAMAALRAGVDLVYILAPERVSNILATAVPEMLTIPYPGSFLTPKQIPLIEETIKKRRITAIVIGGGLGREKITFAAVLKIIANLNLPMVIDADAIRTLQHEWKILQGKKAVLTPHADEFFQLTGEFPKPEFEDRKEKVKRWSAALGVTLLLKGHIDVVSDGRQFYFYKGGSPFMTKGGFGDTLAGICGAILARGVAPFTAACAACYINNKAGEMACQEYKEGVLASDIFQFIPKVIS